MPVTIQSLGIDRLSREARVALVQEIWDSIAAEPHSTSMTEGRRRELDRRVAEDDAHPEDVIPWEQVQAGTLSRLKS
jgi:putative addiction module component (TIGR02574 family)